MFWLITSHYASFLLCFFILLYFFFYVDCNSYVGGASRCTLTRHRYSHKHRTYRMAWPPFRLHARPIVSSIHLHIRWWRNKTCDKSLPSPFSTNLLQRINVPLQNLLSIWLKTKLTSKLTSKLTLKC